MEDEKKETNFIKRLMEEPVEDSLSELDRMDILFGI